MRADQVIHRPLVQLLQGLRQIVVVVHDQLQVEPLGQRILVKGAGVERRSRGLGYQRKLSIAFAETTNFGAI